MNDPIYYFAYGINMDENEFMKRCSNHEFEGVGCLFDYKISFTRYSEHQKGGVADILPEKDNAVWGILYKLTDKDLRSLDKYEGVREGCYRRIKMSISLYDRENIDYEETGEVFSILDKDSSKSGFEKIIDNVWVYEVVQKENFVRPNTKYLDTIIDTAFKYNFPSEYIMQLLKHSYKTVQDKELFDGIVNLATLIREKNLSKIDKNSKEWGGAGVIITTDIFRKNKFKRDYPGKYCVLTQYSSELSWLFFKLSKLFSHRLDFLSKYNFYENLAKAAINYLIDCEKSNKVEKKDDLLLSVIIKAYSLYDKFNRESLETTEDI